MEVSIRFYKRFKIRMGGALSCWTGRGETAKHWGNQFKSPDWQRHTTHQMLEMPPILGGCGQHWACRA